MPRSVMVGIVGDSVAGKTTITRGLVRSLGEDQVTHVCTDDYHKYDRKERAERGITPLHSDCNYIDIMERHLQDLREGHAILKPVYQHKDGTFGPPVYVEPKRFTIIEGLLAFHTQTMRDVFDIRIYLDPPEELRRRWKVARDTTKRGYTTDKVLSELDRREPDSATFIRPQKQHADIEICFLPAEGRNQNELDATITMQPGLPHPDLSSVVNGHRDGLELRQEDDGQGGPVHPRGPGPRARGPDRGARVGEAPLRPAPEEPAPRGVHGRYGPPALGGARRDPTPDLLPRSYRPRLRGARRDRHTGTGEARHGPVRLEPGGRG
ncbi:MAG: phosphoribulokinase [Rubrobacter sp.]|nr:phosphoribulokinase [Rubrobacter sp.]